MTSEQRTTLMLGLLCVVCAALLYLDWQRQGEIDNLHARIDALDVGSNPTRVRPRTVAPAEVWQGDAAQASAVESSVERILRADDDRTLADIARGNA